jgi:hypothetical protein
MNALRHGARSGVLLRIEAPKEYLRYRRLLVREMAPRTMAQRVLAERVILKGWQLAQAQVMEARLLDRDTARARGLVAAEGTDAQGQASPQDGRPISESVALGEVLHRTMAGTGSPYQILSRLEVRLERSHRRLWEEYRQCRAADAAGGARESRCATGAEGPTAIKKSEQPNPIRAASIDGAQVPGFTRGAAGLGLADGGPKLRESHAQIVDVLPGTAGMVA